MDYFAVPAERLVSALTHALSPLAGSFATALAIVLSTVLIRLILVPVGYAQHRADQRRSALMTKVSSLRERYVNSPKRLETALNELYRAEGGSLARGCLPLLVQMPVFAALYQLFVSPTVAGKTNLLLQQTMFGVPLGSHMTAASGPQLLVFVALLALLAAIAYVSSRVMKPPSTLAKLLPYTTVVFAAFLPLAASLYLVTTTAWTVAQSAVLRTVLPM